MRDDSYENYRIYRYIDSPNRTFIWTNQQISVFIMPCLIGFWVGSLFFGILAGLFISFISKKIEKKYGSGALAIMQYWYLFQADHTNIAPPSYKRRFIG